MARRSLGPGRKALYALVTCTVFFAALECGGRLAHGWRRHWLDCHRPHPVLGWSLREGWAGKWSWTGGYARINRQGIRDDEPVRAKQPGERRLVILGDSVTFGAGVRTDGAYPSLLETELRARGQQERVLNGGVTSYDPSQEADWLECFGWQLEPDALAVAFCANDTCPSNRFDGTRQEAASCAGQWLAENSILAYKLQRCIWRLRAHTGPAGTVVDQRAPVTGMPFVAEAYQRIAAAASARKVPVTLIVFPSKNWLTGEDDSTMRSDACQLGESLGWRVVDLTEAFAREPVDELYLTGDPIHPSERGYAVAARAIAEGMSIARP